MPKNKSWNGEWSGDQYFYARVVNFGRGKTNEGKAQIILAQKSYDYDFGDGWVARIKVYEVDNKQATRIKKVSMGFMGYDWMIESIKHKGHIAIPEREDRGEK